MTDAASNDRKSDIPSPPTDSAGRRRYLAGILVALATGSIASGTAGIFVGVTTAPVLPASLLLFAGVVPFGIAAMLLFYGWQILGD